MATSVPTSPTTRQPFDVQVRRTGEIGLVEQGSVADVPPELVQVAIDAWECGIAACAFIWCPSGEAPARAVELVVRREGPYEYVALSGRPLEHLPHRMTARELEVLTLLVAGLSNTELAAALWISSGTAAAHVNHVLRKLGLATRTAAATYALDHGLIHLPLPGDPSLYGNLTVGRLVGAVATAAGAPATRVPARRRRELVVGAVLPATGKGSDDGVQMRNGLQLAIEEINAAGGVRGRTVRADVVNVDVTSSASIRRTFETLLSRGVDVLTSGYLADQEVAHEIAGRSGVPYLHAATSGPMEQAVQDDLSRFGHVFQVCASDTSYAPTFVSYMTQLRDLDLLPAGSDRLVVLRKGWRHVDFGLSGAAELARSSGWDLDVVRVTGPENGDGWGRAVRAALRQPAAAMMIGSYFTADTVQAVAALRATNAVTLAYGIYAPSVPTFRRQLGPAAEGMVWAATTGTYADSRGLAFTRRYAHRFGEPPGRSHAGLAYDRMHCTALAWRLSGDVGDSEELAGNLRAQPYRGVNGVYNFDTPGQAALGFHGGGDPSLGQPQLIFQIQDGRDVIIEGGPFRTGDFRGGPSLLTR